jgi:hypothetical protein
MRKTRTAKARITAATYTRNSMKVIITHTHTQDGTIFGVRQCQEKISLAKINVCRSRTINFACSRLLVLPQPQRKFIILLN